MFHRRSKIRLISALVRGAASCALILTCLASFSAEWESFPGGRSRALEIAPSPTNGFRLMDSLATQVNFTNTLSEERGATNRTLYNGSGVAAGDIDNDGLPDLVFAGIENQLVVFKNLGGWKFTNITHASGLSVTNLHCRGVTLADLNGDRALDLLVTANNRGVLCFRNDGRGHFTEVTREAGTASSFGSLTVALADVDGNGTVDIYVANNRSDDIRDQGEVRLNLVGGKRSVPAALQNRLVLFGEQLLEYGEPDVLLLNDGNGRFRQANWSATFSDETGKPLPGVTLDWGLSAAFRDLNGDLAPDLYVCNDFWTPDRIWFNLGQGKFRAADPFAFRQTSASSMGVDTADLNFDGAPEIFVLDMLSRSLPTRKRQMDAQQSFPSQPGVINDRPQSLRNTFFVSRGDGTFAEIANYAGLPASEWAWQPIFIDADLDGHSDLIITAGHVRDVQDRDANVIIRGRSRNYQAITNRDERRQTFYADLIANSKFYPELKTPIIAFRNRGDLTFEDVTEKWGTALQGVHHGIATADFDGDGDLDFAVNNLNSPAPLYRNDASAPRVTIRLKGKAPNSQALGAIIALRGGAVPEQRQEITAGGRYLSGCDPIAVFAAGKSSEMALDITWRNGRTRTISSIKPNRIYEIEENSELDRPQTPPAKPETKPLFTDVSSKLGHSHHEILFDDFARQPLLPHRLSQLGPGVSWIDFDRDGWDDLVIGTGAGGMLGAYRNDQKGSFSRWTNAPFNQPLHRDTTTLLNIPTPDGKSSLHIGLANYEDARTNTASILRYDLEQGTRIAAWPDLPSSVGPISAADFDADNDLDLFIGSRVIPGRWPHAGESLLLTKNGGAWTPRNLPLASTNPVSASLWTDLNSDGFPELVLAGEFSPIRIFQNNAGELSSASWTIKQPNGASTPLDQLKGWWTSLAAGDFDGDGLMDLVACNWGLNSEHTATTERPLKMYSGVFPPARTLAIIETMFDRAINAYAATRPLDDFYNDLPFLTGKFPTYRAFSESTLDALLGDRKNLATEHTANTLQTILLLNRKSHFELRALPLEAQLAPVFGIAVADFNLDGNEDLFLAQNFFAMRVGVPRLDAGRGLLLTGDGQGRFAVQSADKSGIRIYGEQRGAAVADYDHDGRPDLVVTQNGNETKLYRNNTAARGLRVRITGPPENVDGIGCLVRLKQGARFGPAREIHAGSGYWSQDSATTILGVPNFTDGEGPIELQLRWPGGRVRSIQLPEHATEHHITYN